jgi:hypothetical protein
MADYATSANKRLIKRLTGYSDPNVTWQDFQVELKKEFKHEDSEQMMHTIKYLEKIISEFDSHEQPTPNQVYQFLREFNEVGEACVKKGDLTGKQLTVKLISSLPNHLQRKAFHHATRGKPDPDLENIRPYKEVYTNIEGHAVVGRDIQNLMDQSGGELPDSRKSAFPPSALQDTAKEERALFQKQRLAEPRVIEPPTPFHDSDVNSLTRKLDEMGILQAISERARYYPDTANVNVGHVEYSVESGYINNRPQQGGWSNSRSKDSSCAWCRNIQDEGMRPQAPHKYMNQCHDFKKFIGMGVIHENDENNYIAVGPWTPGKEAVPIQFNSDLPRRQQVIARTINTRYSHIAENRKRAIQEEMDAVLEAEKSRMESRVQMLEASDNDSRLSGNEDSTVLIGQSSLSEEELASVQHLMTMRDALSVNEAQSRPKRTTARKEPYTRDVPTIDRRKTQHEQVPTLQERMRREASYGKAKAPKTVEFQDPLPEIPKATERATRKRSATKGKKLAEMLASNYSYEDTIEKLIKQSKIPDGFTLGEMLSLANPHTTRPAPAPTTGRIDQALQDVRMDTDQAGHVSEVNAMGTSTHEEYSGYADYHSYTPKVVCTLTGRTKLTDVRAVLDTGAEVSVMSYEAAHKFEIPVTMSTTMTLRTITGSKSKFVGFADNVAVTIGNTVVRTRFYIMNTPGLKVLLGFPFFRKARVTLRYPSDYEGGPVHAHFIDPGTGKITTVRTNDETEASKEARRSQHQGMISDSYDSDSESEN